MTEFRAPRGTRQTSPIAPDPLPDSSSDFVRQRPIRNRQAESVDDPGTEPTSADTEYRRRAKPVRVRRNRGGDVLRFCRRHPRPLLAAGVALAMVIGTDALAFHSQWFVLAGSSQIQVSGASRVGVDQISAAFASDLGRNVFFIPLAERQHAIERIAWVKSAQVLRLWPGSLQVRIEERIPVAFARTGSQLRLMDANGVLLDRPAQGTFDFPVLTGLVGVNAGEPNALSMLQARQDQMQRLLVWHDAVNQPGLPAADFSEIDLHDPLDLQATVVPAESSTPILLHFGDRDFSMRYRLYLAHEAEWQRDYPHLQAVDLRYNGMAVMEPGAPAQTAAPVSSAPATASPVGKDPAPIHAAAGARGHG